MTDRDQAAALVRRYDGLRPDVVALATVVSPAVRVTPGLLRRARIELTRNVTVAAEADLWFSALVSSRSVRGFVLDAGAAAVLQGRLAADRALLAACEKLMREVHRDAPPTIRLEEELRFAALRKDEAAVDRLMEAALLTMAEQPSRGPGIARWADRALPELPPGAGDAPSADLLTAATEKFLNAPVEVGVQLTRKGIEISEPPEEGAHVLALPPAPLRLEVRPEGAPEPGVTLEVVRGDVVKHKLGDGVTALELRTADGQVARLRPLTAIRREPVAATGTMKRLVICCDGTWNRPDLLDQGVAAPTNVAKIVLALADTDESGIPQLVHYLSGVTGRRSGIMLAADAGRSVKECYSFLVDSYEPGSQLYFFGFSRGALVARSTVGLILNCGLLRREHRDRVEEAYGLYRSRSADSGPRGTKTELFRRTYSHPDAEIQFVGVWDTVGPLGIPNDPTRPSALMRRWSLHDTMLSRRVRHAYQALAIDERRAGFEPTVWRQHEDAVDQTLEQVWFAGVHLDVGGGYRNASLSDIPLLWMAGRARGCGLAFAPDRLVPGRDVAPDALGEIHDSRAGYYRLIPAADRKLMADGGAVASSAVTRFQADPEYRPPDLVRYLEARRSVTEVGDVQKAPAPGSASRRRPG